MTLKYYNKEKLEQNTFKIVRNSEFSAEALALAAAIRESASSGTAAKAA
jgi:hypothetical protein